MCCLVLVDGVDPVDFCPIRIQFCQFEIAQIIGAANLFQRIVPLCDYRGPVVLLAAKRIQMLKNTSIAVRHIVFYRLGFTIQQLTVFFLKCRMQNRQIPNLVIRLCHAQNLTHSFRSVLYFTVINAALIAHVEFHSIVCLTEYLDLPGVEEVPQGFVSFLEVLIILLCIFQCRVEGFRRGGVDQRGHQGNAHIHSSFTGEIRFLPVGSLLSAQLFPQISTLFFQIRHQLFVIVRGNALFKQVAHHITDKTLLLIGGVLANVAQQTLLRLHSGEQTLELLRVPAGKAELLMVHGQRQDAICKQACNQPLHIHRQETIRFLCKDAQQRFQRGRHRSR